MVAGGVIERRRIALAGEQARVDLALPLDEALSDVLAAQGLVDRLSGPIAATARLVVLDPLGYEVAPATVAEDLVEGGLYTVVDLSASVARAAPGRRRHEIADRADHGSRWVLLTVAALLLLLATVAAGGLVPAWARLAMALVAAVAAAVTAVVWTRDDATPARLLRGVLAPGALAFAAGALLIPAGLDAAVQLSVAAGMLAAAVVTMLIALLTRIRRVRSAAGTVAILLVVFGAVWGIALLAHVGIAPSAAVSLGLVPLLLRALPSALVNLPEGAFIDYEHFMSSRWTVRGSIPEAVTEVRMPSVRGVVDDSSARLAAGTVLLSGAAVLFAPFVVLQRWGEDPFVVAGGCVLLVSAVLALLLVPRHTGSRLLRWTPRVAAALVLIVAVAGFSIGATEGSAVVPWAGDLGAAGMALLATGLLIAAIVAASMTRPVSLGASSLVASRTGDVVEAIAVALALPAALLHADVLTLLRGMMAT